MPAGAMAVNLVALCADCLEIVGASTSLYRVSLPLPRYIRSVITFLTADENIFRLPFTCIHSFSFCYQNVLFRMNVIVVVEKDLYRVKKIEYSRNPFYLFKEVTWK
jgi:hypothetical protein